MDSIVNYSSEDEPEIMDNCTKKRDDSSKSRDGARRDHDTWGMSGSQGEATKRPKKDDTNYESVQMDMSEESEETSSRDGRDVPSPKAKSRSRERRRSRSADNEREATRYKSSKEHHRSSRDYREKDRDRGRKRDKDRDRDRRHRDRHSDRKKDSRRDRDRERHRRRSSSRERRRRSSSRESRRDRRRSKSRSRSHGRSRRSPDGKNNPQAVATPIAAAAAVSAAPTIPPPVAHALPSSPGLIPTVSVPVNSVADMRTERFDWRTQQRVQQLEKMGIDLKKTETAAIELPSYYNPGVVNPSRYAEQMQKRKLLWSHKKSDNVEQAAAAKWESAKFSQDQDGKVQSKFMRLMGIKEPPKASGATSASGGVDLVKKQEELFSTMEQQYEVARQVTHTMRGVGFGFSSQRPF
uniref:Putative transcription termination factor rho n=1 Tax=Lutzomyia longipalpis TaxID=7200 RepID=A0A7G3B1A7_LUTLO